MALFVITVFGEDRPGIISAISGPITRHDGNWERSQLARLADFVHEAWARES